MYTQRAVSSNGSIRVVGLGVRLPANVPPCVCCRCCSRLSPLFFFAKQIFLRNGWYFSVNFLWITVHPPQAANYRPSASRFSARRSGDRVIKTVWKNVVEKNVSFFTLHSPKRLLRYACEKRRKSSKLKSSFASTQTAKRMNKFERFLR